MTPLEPIVTPLRDKPGIIYLAKNKVNGKCYVGQTTCSLNKRRNGHKNKAELNSKLAIHLAINKHGIESFDFSVLQDCCGRYCLDEAEKWWIVNHDCVSPRGYNLTEGGKNGRPAIEVRKRMSEKSKQRPPISEETRRKLAVASRHNRHSEETLKKMSAWQIGRKRPEMKTWPKRVLTEETRRKMSEAQKKAMTPERREHLSQLNTGKIHSDETKRKVSQFHKGRWVGENSPRFGKHLTNEHKQAISRSQKGNPKSGEHKEKIASALKGKRKPWLLGRKRSEETKAKLSASLKGKPHPWNSRRKSCGNNSQPSLDFQRGSEL